MERISDISLFLRVVDLGSISAAARSENLSLAVASKRIQRLEESLGARLLNRTTRRLYPTPEGEFAGITGAAVDRGVKCPWREFAYQPLRSDRDYQSHDVSVLRAFIHFAAAGGISVVTSGRQFCGAPQ